MEKQATTNSSTAAAAIPAIPAPHSVKLLASTGVTGSNAKSIVLPISLPDPGPFGLQLAATEGGSSVLINGVIAGSQADQAGLKTGDVPVAHGRKISFSTFLQTCQGGVRPIVFQVMRKSASHDVVPSKPASSPPGHQLKLSSASAAHENENAPNGTSVATRAPALLPPHPLPSVTVLIEMSNTQLRHELHVRNIKVAKKATKDVMLGKLGVPATQWKSWRKMKVSQLKEELKKQNKSVSGTKEQLLERLGVPTGFGETKYEKSTRELNERVRARKKQKKEQDKNLPKNDPTHENYEEKCCNRPRFPKWGDRTGPAGLIIFPDGSCMEVYRCLTCGKIPKYPNAPPVQEYTSDDEDPFGGDEGNTRNDCVIQ